MPSTHSTKGGKVYECWIRNRPNSFVMLETEEGLLEWLNLVARGIAVGEMLYVNPHYASEYIQTGGDSIRVP